MHPILNVSTLPFIDGVIKRRLRRIEDLPPQRVRREQTVSARMPVSRIARILRVVDDRDRLRLAVRVRAGQLAPAPARGPDRIALLAFAGADRRRWRRPYRRPQLLSDAAGIGEDAALLVADSRKCATRIPSTPSLSSLKTTLSSAFSVVIRSIDPLIARACEKT